MLPSQHFHAGKSRSRNILWLFASIVCISFLAWYTNSFYPESLPFISAFFLIIAGAVFTFFMYFLNNTRTSVLLTLSLLIFLLLRYLHLREYLYVLLLAAMVISLELVFKKR